MCVRQGEGLKKEEKKCGAERETQAGLWVCAMFGEQRRVGRGCGDWIEGREADAQLHLRPRQVGRERRPNLGLGAVPALAVLLALQEKAAVGGLAAFVAEAEGRV